MQFNSYIFIILFLPIFTFLYFTLNRIKPILGKLGLIIASGLFYIYGGWNIAVILGISMVINYGTAWAISRVSKKKILLGLDIACNITLLLYFKYYAFFIENINVWFSKEIPLKELILPLGISFFTFQQIMYVVNVYQKKISLDLLDYMAFILYFPKILMGPLCEPKEFIDQLNDSSLKKVNWDNIAYGIKIFSFGIFKKLVLADTFSKAVNWGYSNMETATSMDWIFVMLFYTFEIYFDFSGYTDMAVGVSTMMNIKLPINFDSPYKAVSIRDFWKRWHISLTVFFTKYIYIPLGGSRKGEFRTYFNTMIIFLISGIWHGANWTFILWGILHGLFSVLDRVFEKIQNKLSTIIKWITTFLVINLLWLLFRSDSIKQWLSILSQMFAFQTRTLSDGLLNAFALPETTFILERLHLDGFHALTMLLFLLFGCGICFIPENNYRTLQKNNWITLLLAAAAFVWGFLCLSSESVFVYYNF